MGGVDLLTVSEGTAGRKGQFSVMLLDCERLQWRIEDIVRGLDEGNYTYEQLMYEMCVAASVGRTLDPAWNSLETYAAGSTKLLHYTDMGHPAVGFDGQPARTAVDRLSEACHRRRLHHTG